MYCIHFFSNEKNNVPDCHFLHNTHQRIIQTALVILFGGSLTIGILGILSYLPPYTSWLGCGVAMASLTLFAIYSCSRVNKNPSHSSMTQKPSLTPLVEKRDATCSLESYHSKELEERVTLSAQEFQDFSHYAPAEEQIIFTGNATNVKFYFGNCDSHLPGGIEDLGWGCAWRCMQTCASAYHHDVTFVSLYQNFSQSRAIQTHEWAEPGNAKIFFDSVSIPSQLFLYRRTQGTSKTPTQACRILNDFEHLCTAIQNHFQQQHTPIIIDDETYAWVLLGMKRTQTGKVVFWIADPHKTNRQEGLYYLVLDAFGNKLCSTGLDNGTNGLQSAQKIDPAKGWMLLIPSIP